MILLWRLWRRQLMSFCWVNSWNWQLHSIQFNVTPNKRERKNLAKPKHERRKYKLWNSIRKRIFSKKGNAPLHVREKTRFFQLFTSHFCFVSISAVALRVCLLCIFWIGCYVCYTPHHQSSSSLSSFIFAFRYDFMFIILEYQHQKKSALNFDMFWNL